MENIEKSKLEKESTYQELVRKISETCTAWQFVYPNGAKASHQLGWSYWIGAEVLHQLNRIHYYKQLNN
jgi:hypothetical protein